MTLKEKTLYLLYKNFGEKRIVNNAVRFFYIYILIPCLIFLIKAIFKNVIKIEFRNSLTDEKHFNAFLSDIDLSIIIENQTSSLHILKFFLTLKKFLIMLDTPEVYFESEFNQLRQINSHKYSGVILTLWSIRKINWCGQSLLNNDSLFNKIKKNRSIKISLNKILSINNFKDTYSLEDFKFLSSLPFLQIKSSASLILFSSLYLETHETSRIKLYLSDEQTKAFKSLLPGEIGIGEYELKNLIALNEILLTKASVRIDEALSISTEEKLKWINKLESQYHYA